MIPARSRLIDLSHTIEAGMITYKGLPAPLVCDHLSREASRANYDAGAEFQIGRIEMVGNTGTYLEKRVDPLRKIRKFFIINELCNLCLN